MLDLSKWDLEYVTPSQLRYLTLRSEGLSPIEIARALNVSMGTLKRSVARARRTQYAYTGRKV